jgi:phosphoribosyl-dephospho-CoA transferase
VQRQLAEQNSRNVQLTEQLESRKKQQTTLEQELALLKRPILASFVLMPGSRQRALGEADQKIVISSGANLMRLELSSPAPAHASYRASLKNSHGQEIWFQSELKSKTVGHAQVVVLSLPTDLLTSDNYSLKLTGVTTSSDLEEIGSCQFQVLRR